MSIDLEFFSSHPQRDEGLLLCANSYVDGGAKWLDRVIYEHTGLTLCVKGYHLTHRYTAEIADALARQALDKPEDSDLQRAAIIFLMAKAGRWRAEVSY